MSEEKLGENATVSEPFEMILRLQVMSEEKGLTGIEAVAGLAMRLSQPHLADYGATTSRHDFTQRQLLSCLIVRAIQDNVPRTVGVFEDQPEFAARIGAGRQAAALQHTPKFSTRSGQLKSSKTSSLELEIRRVSIPRQPWIRQGWRPRRRVRISKVDRVRRDADGQKFR